MEKKDNLLSEVEFDELKAAEKYLENCRKHLRDVMKPAEKARDDLEKVTATEKARLQGTKETKAPNLKPYTESIPAKNRFEIGKLISAAKAEGRPWKIGRCDESLEAQGYRYTFYTTSVDNAKAFQESVQNNKTNRLVLDEDVELAPAELVEPEEAELATIQLGGGEAPAEDEGEMPLTALDVLKSKLEIHGEDGKISIALKGTFDDEDACKLEFDANDEEFAALFAEFHEEEPEDKGDDEPEDKEPEEPEEKKSEDEEPLEEASSAEKKAFKNGGEDMDDLVTGRALARVKDPEERAMLLHQKRMEKQGKTMSDRPEVSDTLKRKEDQVLADIEKKETKMAAAGMTDGDENLDEAANIHLDDLKLFKPWGGAKDVWELIVAQDKLDALDAALEDMYPDGLTTTDLNDILWFEQEWLFDTLDIDPSDLHKAPAEDIIDGEAEVVEPEDDSDEK